VAVLSQVNVVLDHSNTQTKPTCSTAVGIFVCCAVLCSQKSWDGPKPASEESNQNIESSEVNSDLEQVRELNP